MKLCFVALFYVNVSLSSKQLLLGQRPFINSAVSMMMWFNEKKEVVRNARRRDQIPVNFWPAGVGNYE